MKLLAYFSLLGVYGNLAWVLYMALTLPFEAVIAFMALHLVLAYWCFGYYRKFKGLKLPKKPTESRMVTDYPANAIVISTRMRMYARSWVFSKRLSLVISEKCVVSEHSQNCLRKSALRNY